MVVSEDGEAENAGRAMGQLARRLGLTGGHLKEIFLAGAMLRDAEAGPDRQILRDQALEIDRLTREVAALQRALRMMEQSLREAARAAPRMRETVHTAFEPRAADSTARTVPPRSEPGGLSTGRAGSRRRIGMALGLLLLASAGAVGVFVLVDPAPSRALLGSGQTVPAGRHMGFARSARTYVYAAPDRAARVLETLRPGAPVVVRRTLWRALVQWAEVEVGSSVGYVRTTDLDIS